MRQITLISFSALTLFATVSWAENKPVHISSTGAIFTRSYLNPAMGASYEDPNGLVWGDVLKHEGGAWVLTHTPSEAKAACASIGARLPTAEEYATLANFLTAGDYHGCSGNSRYIRPFNPFQMNSRDDVVSNLSGAASWVDSPDEQGLDFEGLENYVGCKYVDRIAGFTRDSVRCVMRAR